MCDKAVSTYPSTIKFVSECVMTQEMCDKTVKKNVLYLILLVINIKLKICVTDLFWRSFLIVYRPEKYKTQRICDGAVDDSLAPLELVPDWVVTSKMIKNL